MSKFLLYADHIDLILPQGQMHSIYFTTDNGTLCYRYKTDTISDVRHPGILLGQDLSGNRWYIHNHFEDGQPSLVPEGVFSKGQLIFPDERIPVNTSSEIIQLGLDQVEAGEAYSWLYYNCQTFVNRAAFNERKSEAVESWIQKIGLGILALVVIKAFRN